MRGQLLLYPEARLPFDAPTADEKPLWVPTIWSAMAYVTVRIIFCLRPSDKMFRLSYEYASPDMQDIELMRRLRCSCVSLVSSTSIHCRRPGVDVKRHVGNKKA